NEGSEGRGRIKRNSPRRNFLHLAAGAAVRPTISRVAWAQAYPTRPITMIVPFPAGGPTDVLARIMAERMRVSLGQSIVIENVTGGNGTKRGFFLLQTSSRCLLATARSLVAGGRRQVRGGFGGRIHWDTGCRGCRGSRCRASDLASSR